MYKTTEADFEYFKERCEYWKNELNMNDWELYFEHKKLRGLQGNTSYNTRSKQATIRLSTEIEENHGIDGTAFHEIGEIFYSETRILLESYFAVCEVDRIIHSYIHILDKLIRVKQTK